MPGGFDDESRPGSSGPPGSAARRHGAHHGRRPHDPDRCGRAGNRRQDRRGGAAARGVPGRFARPYGNTRAGPWEWTAEPACRSFFERHAADDMLGFQMAFDVTGDPAFPEKAAFEVARELGLAVTTHAGVWGATNDDGIRLMHENGFMTPETVYVHAATLSTDSYQRIPATGGTISVSTESEQSAGQGYPPTWQVRRHDIPVALSMDTSVWWSGGLFSAMRTTLGADRAREHLEAQVKRENRLVGADLAAVRRTVEATVGYLRSELGDEAWAAGMNPDLPGTEVLDNPYQYTEFKSESTHGARGSIFGEDG